MPTEVQTSKLEADQRASAQSHPGTDMEALDTEIAAGLNAHQHVNQLTVESEFSPRHWLQKVIRRALAWYTPPIQLFQRAILGALQRTATTLQAHEATLAEHTSAVQQLRDGQTSLLEKFDLLAIVRTITPSSSILPMKFRPI